MLNFPLWWWLAPCGAVSALLFAFLLYRQMLAAAPGDDQMQKVAGHVREGALAYLKRQYRVVAIVFLGLILLLMWQAFALEQQHGLVPFAFLTGGILSGLAGFIGMNTATRASNRTAQAAKESLNGGLQVAFRAGAVMGLLEGDIRAVNRLMAEGRGLLTTGAYSTAMAKFRRVVTRNPFHVAATEGLAEACDGLGQREEAEFYRRRARKVRNEG